jgi:hypothetical protein
MGTSMSRYAPPIGTAGFDRVFVNGYKREPAPPPKMMAATDFVFDIADTLVSFCATASERMTRWILLFVCFAHQYFISCVLDTKISKFFFLMEKDGESFLCQRSRFNQEKKERREKLESL